MKKLVFLLLPCLFLGSCSIFKPKTLPYPSGVIFPLEKNEEMAYQGKIIELLQKVNGILYFSSQKGIVYCIDGLERKVLWKFETKNPLASPPHLGKEKIYVYDSKNTLYCLDQKGKLLWKREVEEDIANEVRESRERVYLGTDEGGFLAFNSLNGERLWRFQAGGAIRSSPAFFESYIIFGCDDGSLYFLNRSGKLIDKFKSGDKIQASPLVDGTCLYFGSDDHYFYCLDLTKRRMRWKVKTGGRILSRPIVDEKRVFFICWDSILYSLNKNNGTILWWQVLPSRSFYQLEIIEGKIVASSFSPKIVCFDVKTGEKRGEYQADQEVKSNPLWLEPHLLVSLYDYQKDEGKLVFLKKAVKVTLTSSKPSPLKLGEEVTFAASATGFFQPEYEFLLKQGEKKEVVQEISEKKSWAWFPEKDGIYLVGVRVVDAKEKTSAEIPYTVEKLITKKPDLIIYNGKIRTMTEGNPWVEALAVAKDRIIYAGKNKEVLELRTDKTVVINTGENFVLPGFNDSKVQMLKGGLSLLGKEIWEEAESEQVNKEEVKEALLRALSEASKFGITTVQDDSPSFVLEAYKEFLKEDRLTARVFLSCDLKEELNKIKEFKAKFKEEDNKFIKFGVVRGDLDGNIAERKAALLAPYSDNPKKKGKLLISPKELYPKIKELEKNKFQIALGASGDRALRIALTGIEEALKDSGRKEKRHRIERIQLIDPEDFDKFAKLNVIAVSCPYQLIKEREEAQKRVGLKRVRSMFSWKTLLDKKGELAFASNWPREPLDPLLNIYVALTREAVDGDSPGGWLPWEKISMDQALTAFTKTPARACLEESIKGTLEKDKLADIIILSKNLYEIPAEEILKTEVIMTFTGGKLVYQKPGFGIQIFDPEILRLLNILFFSLNLGRIQIQ